MHRRERRIITHYFLERAGRSIHHTSTCATLQCFRPPFGAAKPGRTTFTDASNPPNVIRTVAAQSQQTPPSRALCARKAMLEGRLALYFARNWPNMTTSGIHLAHNKGMRSTVPGKSVKWRRRSPGALVSAERIPQSAKQTPQSTMQTAQSTIQTAQISSPLRGGGHAET